MKRVEDQRTKTDKVFSEGKERQHSLTPHTRYAECKKLNTKGHIMYSRVISTTGKSMHRKVLVVARDWGRKYGVTANDTSFFLG